MRMEEYEKSTTFRHPPLGSKEDCALANAVADSRVSKSRICMVYLRCTMTSHILLYNVYGKFLLMTARICQRLVT